jgi:hypothetical protein
MAAPKFNYVCRRGRSRGWMVSEQSFKLKVYRVNKKKAFSSAQTTRREKHISIIRLRINSATFCWRCCCLHDVIKKYHNDLSVSLTLLPRPRRLYLFINAVRLLVLLPSLEPPHRPTCVTLRWKNKIKLNCGLKR